MLTFKAFASMGGLLSGIDQSLISGANLFLPTCELSFPIPLTMLT